MNVWGDPISVAGMEPDTLIREYLLLGLRFDRVEDGYVDSFTGDPALRRGAVVGRQGRGQRVEARGDHVGDALALILSWQSELHTSGVLNSAAKVTDREITSVSQVAVGDVLRGFVKNVADKGLFVGLGGDVTAMIKISDLSDRFLKEWKDSFQVDQLVKGRVTSVDETLGQIQMSLKASVVENDYVPLLAYRDDVHLQQLDTHLRAVSSCKATSIAEGGVENHTLEMPPTSTR